MISWDACVSETTSLLHKGRMGKVCVHLILPKLHLLYWACCCCKVMNISCLVKIGSFPSISCKIKIGRRVKKNHLTTLLTMWIYFSDVIIYVAESPGFSWTPFLEDRWTFSLCCWIPMISCLGICFPSLSPIFIGNIWACSYLIFTYWDQNDICFILPVVPSASCLARARVPFDVFFLPNEHRV